MKEEYHTTRFRTSLLANEIPDHFFIITAWNPQGTVASPSENEMANAALLKNITAQRWSHFPITGHCQDHAEDGFGVICLKKEAIQLGLTFRQDAIYEISANQVILVDCQQKEDEVVIGSWSELLDA